MELNSEIQGFELVEVPQKNFEEEPFEKVCPLIEVDFFGNEKRAVDISCGENVTAIIDEFKALYTFGKSSYDRLGHKNSSITKILGGVERVKMGYRHGFAYKPETGEVYGWGFNIYKQLGTTHQNDIRQPEIIQSLSNLGINEISCGFFHSAAVGT